MPIVTTSYNRSTFKFAPFFIKKFQTTVNLGLIHHFTKTLLWDVFYDEPLLFHGLLGPHITDFNK